MVFKAALFNLFTHVFLFIKLYDNCFWSMEVNPGHLNFFEILGNFLKKLVLKMIFKAALLN